MNTEIGISCAIVIKQNLVREILAKATPPLHNSTHDLPSTSLRMTGRGNKWSWHPIAIGLKFNWKDV